MSTTDIQRPAPILTEDNHEFWEAAKSGRLVAQKCNGCGRLRHPPRPMCPNCHSLEFDQVELSGLGKIYSYSILHHPQLPVFSYPIIAVLVELDEGVRLLSDLEGVEPSDVRIGRDYAVPVFFPRDQAS
jgi:uncharacterized OB-fold protein